MSFPLQPTLENEAILLLPLQENDFDALYAVASDPEIWEQHPDKDRWKQEVFRTFFEEAIQSKGAFKIISKATGTIIGSSRFYNYNESDSSILIGYTFYAKNCWGKGINHSVKKLMLDHAFQHVSGVYFHAGPENIRSQISITRLGAEKINEEEIMYYGERPKLKFIYLIRKEDWILSDLK